MMERYDVAWARRKTTDQNVGGKMNCMEGVVDKMNRMENMRIIKPIKPVQPHCN